MLRAGMFGDKNNLVRVGVVFVIRFFDTMQLRKLSSVTDVKTIQNIVLAVQVLSEKT